MNGITAFIQSGMWEYRLPAAAFASITPVVIEAGVLAKRIYDCPSLVPEKIAEAKKWAVTAFVPNEDEERHQAIKRIAKNALIALAVVATAAAATTVAFLHLSPLMAIPAALSAIIMIGKGISQGAVLIGKFKTDPAKDPQEEKRRVVNLAIKTALVAAASIAFALLSGYVLSQMLYGTLFSIKFPPSLPNPKWMVFLEYAAVGLLHFGIAGHKFIKGHPKEGVFHLFSGALGFLFPACYWNDAKMRLHHSFTGLIMMAVPSRPIQFIGSLITLDSACYLVVDNRSIWDFLNVVDLYPEQVIVGNASAMALESIE